MIHKVKDWLIKKNSQQREAQFEFVDQRHTMVKRYDGLIFCRGLASESVIIDRFLIIDRFHDDLVHVTVSIYDNSMEPDTQIVEILELDESLAIPHNI